MLSVESEKFERSLLIDSDVLSTSHLQAKQMQNKLTCTTYNERPDRLLGFHYAILQSI